MIEIDDKLIATEVITAHFSCDLGACGGACCVEGNSGAPLLQSEMESYTAHYQTFRPYMTPQGVEAIEAQGHGVVDHDGDLTTPLLGGHGDAPCAYVIEENGKVWCAIEKAFRRGECPVNKPISCHLYPIRLGQLSNGTTTLMYNRWAICRAAQELGKAQGTRVFQGLKEAIERHFGPEFYEQLQEVADYIDTENELHNK